MNDKVAAGVERLQGSIQIAIDNEFGDSNRDLRIVTIRLDDAELIANSMHGGSRTDGVDNIEMHDNTGDVINSCSKNSSNSIDIKSSPPEIPDNSIDAHVVQSPKIELDGNKVYLDLVLIGSIVEEPDGLKFKTDCYDVLCSYELRAIAGKLDALNVGLSGAAP